MTQDAISALSPVLYADSDLIKAKDVIKNNTLPPGKYEERNTEHIALWIHYCNKNCEGEDQVTEDRLNDYIDWLVESGTAESINTGKHRLLHA
ncbi:hypothetical protein GGI10_006424, partial [Coemansia sp. RSA 2530]